MVLRMDYARQFWLAPERANKQNRRLLIIASAVYCRNSLRAVKPNLRGSNSEHGVKIVLDSSALQGGLLYVHDTADITTEIIRRIASDLESHREHASLQNEGLSNRNWLKLDLHHILTTHSQQWQQAELQTVVK